VEKEAKKVFFEIQGSNCPLIPLDASTLRDFFDLFF